MLSLIPESESIRKRLSDVGRLLGGVTVISITDYPTGRSLIQATTESVSAMTTAQYRVHRFNVQGGTNVEIEFVKAEAAPVV
jgi:hypothetical protein